MSSEAPSALAPATRRAYESDWLVFASWCVQRSATAIPAPAATVAAFLADEADRGFRPVTIARRAAAIAAAHRAQDHPNPCDFGAVAAVMSGIRRQVGTDQLRRAAPLELDNRKGEADTLNAMANIDLRNGACEQARAEFARVLELYRELGNRKGEADTLNAMANIDLRQHP